MPSPASTREIEEAFNREGLRPRRSVLISPPEERKRGRCAYRVELEDGRTIKARRLESAEAASRLFELRVGLEEAFAPVTAQHGRVLLEAWIEGVPLTELDSEARAEEAGALLGRLHSIEVAATPPTVSTLKWRERTRAELQILGEGGKLGLREVARLDAELDRWDPETARLACVHRDFCAENMLIDARGRLRVIDNEWLTIDPAGLDLGRTFTRWPMSEGAWGRFLRAYRSTARVDPGPLPFWKIVSALWSARIRLNQAPERLAGPLELLRRFAELPEAAVEGL
jgi:aminoglycoside phosphotransferase (APT) family kinase protein